MKTISFTDHDGQKLTLQHSSLATDEAYRIYLELKDIKGKKDRVTGHEIPLCLHLTRNQAEMLIGGIKDLFSDNDNL